MATSTVMVLLLPTDFPLPMIWCWSFGILWIFTFWIIACSGQLVPFIVGYFGFLHASEFTILNLPCFMSWLHLGVQDIGVASPSAPSWMPITIKGSRTYPFRKGCFIHIGVKRHPQFFLSCAQGWWSRPPVFVSKWTTSPSIKFVGLASADYGFSLGAGKLLQSQLSHRSCYCCSSQWSTGPFNTIYRPLVQQCLSALNKDASWSVSCPFQKSRLTRFLEYLQCFLATHLWIP